jgi:glutaminase
MNLELQNALEKAHAKYKDLKEGAPAGYITALAHANPDHFGIAAMTMDGEMQSIGHADTMFSIQSISKVFTLMLAFREFGIDTVYKRIATEPSGERYNSVELMDDNRPYNPLVNAGAITTAGMLYEQFGNKTTRKILEFMSLVADEKLNVDSVVKIGESNVGARNMAIGYLLNHAQLIPNDVKSVVETYNFACAINVNAKILASMSACLANKGIHPRSGAHVLNPLPVQHTLSIMLMCGMYDFAGTWAVDIGVPAKSGVAGGIIAPVIGRFGLGLYSPLIDKLGNSVRGIKTCSMLDDELDIHAIDVV